MASGAGGDVAMEAGGTVANPGGMSQAADAAAAAAAADPMRAYRACLHCRARKTKCTLDVNGGRPVS